MSVYRLALRTGLAGLLLLAGSAFTAAAEIEAGLPADTTAVLTVNLKQLLHAPLLKQHGLTSLRQLCRDTDGIRTILETLGLDPFRDLDRLTVACVGPVDTGECLVILHGRFDTARLHLAAKMLVKEYSDRFVMHKDEKLKYLSIVSTGGHGSIICGAGIHAKKGAVLNVHTKGCLLDAFGGDGIALLDKTTLVAATSEKLLKETCQRLADKDTAARNRPMRRLFAELDGKQTILFAMRSNGAAIDKSKTADSGAAREGYRILNLRAASSDENNSKSAEQVKAKTITQLMKEFNKLFKEAKYAEAEMVALRVKEIDPDNAMATAAIVMARYQRNHNPYENDTAKSDCGRESDPQIVPSLFPASFLPPPPPPESPSSETKEESSKPSWELSGSISLDDDFTLRCAVRTTNNTDARALIKGFTELRLRADGLMTFLAGSSKEYAFLKDIPRSFLAVRKGRVVLIEGHLSPEMLGKLLGSCRVNSR